MSEWKQETGCPDPDWEEWHWTAPDDSFQLRIFTGFDTYMMVKIEADGTRHSYGHSDAATVQGAQREIMDKAAVGVAH